MSLITRAAVVESGGAPFTLSEVVLDDPAPHEAVVRLVAAGLCHTDLSVASGGLPFPLPGVLGHEGAGVVEAVGSAVTGVAPGDHVVLSFTSCGACRECHGGHPAYCASWLPLNLLGGRRADGTATGTEPRSAATSSASPPSPNGRWWTSAASSRSTPRCRSPRSPRWAAACRPASAPCGTY